MFQVGQMVMWGQAKVEVVRCTSMHVDVLGNQGLIYRVPHDAVRAVEEAR